MSAQSTQNGIWCGLGFLSGFWLLARILHWAWRTLFPTSSRDRRSILQKDPELQSLGTDTQKFHLGSGRPGRSGSFESAASSKETPRGPFNLDQVDGLRYAVRACGKHGEIILFTSNNAGLLNAVNMALQLIALNIAHHLVLADQRVTCVNALARWSWLGCGWSHGLSGFEKRYGESKMVRLWSLWSVDCVSPPNMAICFADQDGSFRSPKALHVV